MQNIRFVKPLLGLALLAGGGWLSYRIGSLIHIRSVIAASRSPFTILYRDFTYIANANGDLDVEHPTSSQTYLKARKGDGSISEITFATYEHSSGAHTIALRKVHSMADRALIVGYTKSAVKSTFPLKDEELAAIKALPADRSCVTDNSHVGAREYLGTGELNGVRVVKHRIKTETTVTESWSAPELDCELVYLKTVFLGTGGRATDATLKAAVKIMKEEPQAWIFDSVNGVEMPPSQAIRAELEAGQRASGQPVPLPHEKEKENDAIKLRRQDDNYVRRWQARR